MEIRQTLKNDFDKLRRFGDTNYYRKGQVAYDGNRKVIIFYWDDKPDKERFSIRTSRINTPDRQMLFLDHLSEKELLNAKLLAEFFYCLKLSGHFWEGTFQIFED